MDVTMHASFDDEVQEQPNEGAIQIESDERICRICLCEESDDHPFISPCSCTGSTKFIGQQCLTKWLDSKRFAKETSHVKSYIWRGLTCEICKTPFAIDTEQVLNYQVPQSNNFLILESVSKTQNITIHVVDFDFRNSVEVGRAGDSEVRI